MPETINSVYKRNVCFLLVLILLFYCLREFKVFWNDQKGFFVIFLDFSVEALYTVMV